MELIKIQEENGKKTVNARDLHEFLESKQDFTTWIKNRIKQFNFDQDIDFVKFHKIMERETGATKRIEYHLSLDMSKELAMIEKTEKGKQARKYFIECEKQANQQLDSMSPLVLFETQVKAMRMQQQQLNVLEDKVKLIEAQQTTVNNDYFTVAGYCALKSIKVSPAQANIYGRKCAKFSRDHDYPVDKTKDSRYGHVGLYHIDVLQEIIKNN